MHQPWRTELAQYTEQFTEKAISETLVVWLWFFMYKLQVTLIFSRSHMKNLFFKVRFCPYYRKYVYYMLYN